MSWWHALATLGLSLAQAGTGRDVPANGPLFTVNDYVAGADGEGSDRVALLFLPVRLIVPDGPDHETFIRLLARAAERGVSLRIRIDADAGRLAADGAHVEYPLCAIAAGNGASFGNSARNCPRRAPAPNAERFLAFGIAQMMEYPEAARHSLAAALAATPALPVRAQVLALGSRGEASEAASEGFAQGSIEQDRLIADALADFRRQVTLAPDEAGPRYAVARALVTLGGYDETLRIYEGIGQRWPEEAFDVAIRTGALFRQRGDYVRALRQLDEFASADSVRANGMRFHYHRAWTLTLLNRLAEAEREIDQGFASQPDYPSAYQLRSCVRARLGRLEEALADQQRGLELSEAATTNPPPALRADMARSREIIEALREAIARAPERPLSTPCELSWDRWTRPRSLSPFLAEPARPH
jgi:tetratricopeptide (TPR) repeat protein